MSSDQRPARTVIVAPDAARVPPERRAVDPVGDTTAPAAGAAPRTLLLSGLFLFACVAGAVGVALAPWLMSGR
ncbi:hypothetical protein FSB78_00780 [Sphingomonas ginsenosidivorax]|uniref:Uncharacterized protein n=1 Tax=Sphingomonas ginsenosidivorax TaxID=862135 RepID=A0A5C6UCI1_9SPHN|nr:hypothetical protein [Sphingomonas ginsenosidivorax]TXC69658.1 hypothetical protein FSB78_00780 [Sphingomonas ginsenosidivorax]